MAKHELIKCLFEDEDCCPICQQSNEHIFYKVVEGTNACPRHGGPSHAQNHKVEAANQYRVEVWQRRLNEFGNVNEIKSLRDEIGVLRLLMEETLKRCENAGDLLMFSARIQSIASDIQRLVTACDRLEKSMGEMMDKPTALKFAGTLMEIVSSEVNDSEALERISYRILEEMRG